MVLAVAVACGSSLFIHKNNKPYYKFQTPSSAGFPKEIDAWKKILEVKNNATDQIIEELLKELADMPFNSLTNK